MEENRDLLCTCCQFLWREHTHLGQSVATSISSPSTDVRRRAHGWLWARARWPQHGPSPLQGVLWIPLTGCGHGVPGHSGHLPLNIVAVNGSLKVGSWIWGQEWFAILPFKWGTSRISISEPHPAIHRFLRVGICKATPGFSLECNLMPFFSYIRS